MNDEIVQQTPLRDTLASNFEAAEAGILPTADERARDDGGRFVKKETKAPIDAMIVEGDPGFAKDANGRVVDPPSPPALQRPTTWKKDYLPIWDKLATGTALTAEEARKLAEYTNQRETEYKTGVSTYKTEAQNARELQEALSPVVADLQQRGKTPAQWITEVGQYHQVLSRGSPEQKLQLIHALAQNYGVSLQQQPQQQNPLAQLLAPLMQHIAPLAQKVQGLEQRQQKQDQTAHEKELSSLQEQVDAMRADTSTYPHFEAVREDMAQLLEAGVARDLPTAYKMTVRNNDELYQQEVDRLFAEKKPSQAAVVAGAKARAVSTKSATPSGQVASGGAKDRRAILAEQFEAQGGGRV